eukprot:7353243-Pyramimonas_sp.AAC.1
MPDDIDLEGIKTWLGGMQGEGGNIGGQDEATLRAMYKRQRDFLSDQWHQKERLQTGFGPY